VPAEAQEKYALWLMPEGEARERLSALIRELSERHGTPAFEPHITLLGGLMPPVEEMIAGSRKLALALRPFAVEFGAVGFLDDYWRCLFIRVRETGEVMGAGWKAREIFGRADDPPFMPHLSLMYCNMRASRKRKIISSIGERIPAAGFVAASLHVYSTEGEPALWSEVEEISFGK